MLNKKSNFPYIGALFALVAIISLSLRLFSFFYKSYILFNYDDSFDFSITRSFLNGQSVLLGSPTHIGGRHLGPVYYWVLAFNFLLGMGSDFHAYIFFALECLLSCILIAFFTSRFFDARVKWYAFAATLMTFCGPLYVMQFREPWQGNFVFLPSTCLLFTFYLCIQHGWRYFLWFCAAASFLVISHYACAPFAAGTGLVVLLRLFFYKDTHAKDPETLLFAHIVIPALVITALWLPMIIFEVHYPSNIRQIVMDFITPKRRRIAGIREALQTTAYFFNHHLFSSPHTKSLESFGGNFYNASSIGIVLLIFLMTGFFQSCAKKDKFFIIGLVVSIAAYVLFSSRAPLGRPNTPGIYEYYYNGILPLPALFVGLSFGYAFSQLIDSTKTDRNASRLLFSAQKASAAAFLIFTTIIFSGFMLNSRSMKHPESSSSYFHSLGSAQCVATSINRDLHQNEHAVLMVSSESAQMKNSYLYFLGQDYYGDMNVFGENSPTSRQYMKELTPAKDGKGFAYYAVSCPYKKDLWPQSFTTIDNRTLKVEYDLHILNTQSCRFCRISRLNPM